MLTANDILDIQVSAGYGEGMVNVKREAFNKLLRMAKSTVEIEAQLDQAHSEIDALSDKNHELTGEIETLREEQSQT